MTPKPYTDDTLVQQTTAATNREKYALIKDGVQVTFHNPKGEDDVQTWADEVYRHVYRVYPTLPSPYFESHVARDTRGTKLKSSTCKNSST